MEENIHYRVEKHIIKHNHKFYNMLDDFCFKAKNLYNFANYQIRQSFINNNEYIPYSKLDKMLKQVGFNDDYSNMPTAQSAQQLLRLLDQNWKSFFKAIKDWSKNKDKYNGKPKMPKYKKKNGRETLILTNQNCKLKDGVIYFPKSFNGFTLKTKVNKFNQVRLLPRSKHIIIEVIYKVKPIEINEDNNRYYSIDVGLDNLLTVTNNFGKQPFVINGKGLKSINQYYNKKLSHYREIAKRMNNLDWTTRMNRLTIKRNNRVKDIIHKVSRYIIHAALKDNVSAIVIGNNKDWKRESKMSKRVNQSFVSIPHQDLIKTIKYKAEEVGIKVIPIEESYTSGTSFLDNELPTKENYNKNRRKYRGLFISNKGIKINADVNGSYQILKKVFPNAYSNGIEGVGLHPFVVHVY